MWSQMNENAKQRALQEKQLELEKTKIDTIQQSAYNKLDHEQRVAQDATMIQDWFSKLPTNPDEPAPQVSTYEGMNMSIRAREAQSQVIENKARAEALSLKSMVLRELPADIYLQYESLPEDQKLQFIQSKAAEIRALKASTGLGRDVRFEMRNYDSEMDASNRYFDSQYKAVLANTAIKEEDRKLQIEQLRGRQREANRAISEKYSTPPVPEQPLPVETEVEKVIVEKNGKQYRIPKRQLQQALDEGYTVPVK